MLADLVVFLANCWIALRHLRAPSNLTERERLMLDVQEAAIRFYALLACRSDWDRGFRADMSDYVDNIYEEAKSTNASVESLREALQLAQQTVDLLRPGQAFSTEDFHTNLYRIYSMVRP